MKTTKVALLGFGSIGTTLSQILLEKKEELREKYDTEIAIVAISTKTRGIIVDAWGLDLEQMLEYKESGKMFPPSMQSRIHQTSLDVAEKVDYDVLIEMTPLEYANGRTATEHIKAALTRGKDVISINKGPLAWSYKELTELAEQNGCKFMYEAAILDAIPLFSMVRENMKMCKVLEIKGILSRTLNYLVTGMEHGREFDDIMAEGKARGFIEANPMSDLTGKESLIQMVALANGLMDANITPKDVELDEVECSQGITLERIKAAAERGNCIKYICRAYRQDGKIKISVRPEEISKFDSYASVSGTSLAVSITTDLMGTMTIIEEAAATEQTGYGVFADLLTIIAARKDA
ncbi:MAG: hypothetical protein KBS66_08335 [Eubacterium sp.]|nr:hypothetical protein [Candidatus Colimonas fimequi]